MNKQQLRQFSDKLYKADLWLKVVVMIVASLLPALSMRSVAWAAPTITERELQSTTSEPSATTDLTWVFDTTADAGNADHIEIEFCDAPLGTCATTNTPTIAASPTATLGGPWTTTTVTSTTRGDGDGGGTGNQIVIDKTTVDDAASKSELTISLAATDITNNASANKSYYTRMRIYSDTGTTLEWEGVFAQSTAAQLTINARVQERLDFCVGTTGIDDATTSVAADCTAVTGTTVDIGIVDSSAVSVSPVVTGSGGNNVNGVAMIRTNAINGAVISYFAEQETSSGKLKVAGATCSGTSTTDQCFNSSGTTQNSAVAGTEEFGMTISGINCGSVTAYTCTFSSDTYNLVRDTQYDGSGSGTYETGNSNTWAWDDTGTVDIIASSASSTVKVIDDEAMILKFAATSGVTTPTGQYTVTSTYIATATF